MRIGVLGAGTWGVALARMLSKAGHEVMIWSALKQEIDQLSATHTHPNLPGMEIPEAITYTKAMETVCEGKEILLFAVPSPFVRATARKAAPYVKDGQVIVDVAKGIEADTLKTMTQIIRDEIPNPAVKLVALSGPTHAEEVAKDMPTTIVSACEDLAAADLVQEVFTTGCMRVYTNDDVHGVELCGALKNVIALASGIATGLGCGDNARAALITRGIAVISRLGAAMGCREQTFGGLAGIGDLIVTATSMHSRNNRCGMLLGQGLSKEEATAKVGMVVEGLNALPAALRLAEQYRVEMPIVETVDAVVSGRLPAAEAVQHLMTRGQKSELNRSAFDNKYD